MDCPACHFPIPDQTVIKEGMSLLGKRGKGPKKARTSEQCRKAAKAGWKKRAPKTGDPSPTQPIAPTP